MACRPSLIGLLPFLVLAAGCGNNASGAPARDVEPISRENGAVRVSAESRTFLDVHTVASNSTAPAVRAPARVAFREGAVAKVAAPIEGHVVQIQVKVGDRVKAGDALVTIESPAAAAARADLQSSLAAQKVAQSTLERQKGMMDKGVGIESEKFQAEMDLAKSQAELARAERTAAYIGSGSGSTVVVRAPIAGTVIQRDLTVGSAADPSGTPLIEIGDPSALWVVADVFEHDLTLVKPGAAATVELASASTPVTGRVVSVGSALNDGTRSAPVYIAIDSAPELRAGMYARVSVAGDATMGIDVPVSAVLVKDGKRSVVYVERADHDFEPRDVSVSQPIDGHVQVLAGLSQGDQVVFRGALLLDEAADQLL